MACCTSSLASRSLGRACWPGPGGPLAQCGALSCGHIPNHCRLAPRSPRWGGVVHRGLTVWMDGGHTVRHQPSFRCAEHLQPEQRPIPPGPSFPHGRPLSQWARRSGLLTSRATAGALRRLADAHRRLLGPAGTKTVVLAADPGDYEVYVDLFRPMTAGGATEPNSSRDPASDRGADSAATGATGASGRGGRRRRERTRRPGPSAPVAEAVAPRGPGQGRLLQAWRPSLAGRADASAPAERGRPAPRGARPSTAGSVGAAPPAPWRHPAADDRQLTAERRRAAVAQEDATFRSRSTGDRSDPAPDRAAYGVLLASDGPLSARRRQPAGPEPDHRLPAAGAPRAHGSRTSGEAAAWPGSRPRDDAPRPHPDAPPAQRRRQSPPPDYRGPSSPWSQWRPSGRRDGAAGPRGGRGAHHRS